MPGRVFEQLLERAHEQHGHLRPDDARALNLDPKRLVDLERRGQAVRVAQGIYRLNLVPHDDLEEYLVATMWPKGLGVISHETALDLYDLCDINPSHIDVTVPPTYRVTRDVPPGYRLHRRQVRDDEVTLWQAIPIVTVTRAILDCIESHVRAGLIEQAVEAAQRTARITRANAAMLRDRLKRQQPI
jgi:predicted transcriptional regulator of viral defense system